MSPAKRCIAFAGCIASVIVSYVAACSDAERSPFDPPVASPDAAADADADPFLGRCERSEGPDDWAPPSEIPTRSIDINGIACIHPTVRAECMNGWCRIPAGCFVMGSPENEWGRGASSEDEVAMTLTHDFVIQQFEMTREEWLALGFPLESGKNPYEEGGDCAEPRCPAASVSWFEAVAFANALSDRDGLARCYELLACTGSVGVDFRCEDIKQSHASLYDCPGYRLPMEPEWEYAARAGTRTAFYSGDITPQGVQWTLCCVDKALSSIAWYCQNSGGWTHPVGQKAPNAWGLRDMSGNASEWVNDPYEGSTAPGPHVDYGSTLSPKKRAVSRGGGARVWAGLLRSASGPIDYDRNVHVRGINLGFRLVRSTSNVATDAGK